MGRKHFSHQKHVLVICCKADHEQAQCAVCADKCTGMTYGCKECRFYIHYSCLLLPKEILHHPAHPPHSLAPRPASADFTCSVCRHSKGNGFCFHCQEPGCGFTIDVKCAFPLPAVTYPAHGHRLYFFDELPEDAEHRQCKVCHGPCRSSALCCLDLDCEFGVHLACERPLCSIKHPVSHKQPWCLCQSEKFLELKASIDEVDVRRRHCRYCSKQMGPQTPLYYCDDCKLIAHVNCIFSTVDQGEDLEMICLETKQDGRKEGNSEANEAAMQHVETFGDMVNSLNKKEEAELEDVYKRRVVEIIRVLAWQNDAGGSSSDRDPSSPFLDEAFLEFRKKLPRDIRRINSLAVASKDERVVQVAEYKMTKKLAPDLRKLFATYGDLSEESKLTLKPRILVFVMLCGTIYSMANTEVALVTEELLYNWWKYLMFIYLSRFKIQFAIDRLKVVMRAHYTNLWDDDNSILRMAKEIRELSEEIKVSQSKLDRLKNECVSGKTDENLVEACLKNARAWKYETEPR